MMNPVRFSTLIVCALLIAGGAVADSDAIRVPGEIWEEQSAAPARDPGHRRLKEAGERSDPEQRNARELILEPLDPQERQALEQADEGDRRKALKVGVLRRDLRLPATFEQLDWQRTDDGGYVADLLIRSPDAASLRAQFDVSGLPEGARIRYLQPGAGNGVAASRFVGGTGEQKIFWSPSVRADAMRVEIYLPPDQAREPASLKVLAVMHQIVEAGPEHLRLKDLNQEGNSDSCNVDAACADSDAGNYETSRLATAKMIFVDGESSYICTGTLLNDQDGSTRIPWFLTSSHCINSQAAAGSAEFYWFFSKRRCSGDDSVEVNRTTDGGQLLSNDDQVDYSFMRLSRDPPAGVGLSGWTTLQPLERQGYSLHHPQGDIKKYAEGRTGARFDSFFDTPETHTPIVWDEGTTEAGSSGAGLWVVDGNSAYLAGVLSGGTASCSNTRGADQYGRFDLAYPHLKEWLVNGSPSGMVEEGFVTVSGKVRASHNTSTPVNALVLVNGQHTFSSNSNGTYSLTARLNDNGRLRVFAWAKGFRQYMYDLYPPGDEVTNDIYMELEPPR